MSAAFPAAPAVAGLGAYTGTFDRERAAHLLRRSLIGPTAREIDQAVDRGLSATLDLLLAERGVPNPPVNHFFADDPLVPIGETWIEARYQEDVDVGNYRRGSLRAWFHRLLHEGPFHLRERMTLFWINHFGISDVDEQRAAYQYIRLFQRRGLGNFRQLMEEVTVNPAMLVFLNGRYNRAEAPDENYARELLELFTVQKGQPGDINYTEEDIREIARVLTGWRVDGLYSRTEDRVTSYFDERRHDTGSKQLSTYFGNAMIENGGASEYKILIGIIFRHPETPRAIVRDLYMYFVDYRITDEVERSVIRPLAELLVEKDFEVRPVMRNLLGSAYFFRQDNRATQIKSPYEFVNGITRTLGGYAHLDLGLRLDYELARTHHYWIGQMDMDFLNPPTVSGWKAYYQAPAFHRSWITSSTLQQRQQWIEWITRRGVYSQGAPRPLDWLAFIDRLPQSEDVNAVIADTIATFLALPLHPDQVAGLKEILLPGLPDFEWTVQYRQYRRNPSDPDSVSAILNKVRDFFRALFSMAEFQLQ
jgi:uncharacterized protein (DUF1800 family)